MVADLAAAQHNSQGKITAVQQILKSEAERKTREVSVSSGHVMAAASPASGSPLVPSQRLLEHMLALELEEAKTACEDKIYYSGTAARMYGKCKETTVAARIVEMFMTELAKEMAGQSYGEYVDSGGHIDVDKKSMQKVKAQVTASVKVEHRRLDKHVAHDLHAAALMLLAQLQADSSAGSSSKTQKRPSETTKPQADTMPQTSEMTPQQQAASQLPNAAFAARVGKCPEGSSESAASGHQTESKAASEAIQDMPPKGTQRSAEQVFFGKAASEDGTGKGAAEATAQRASLQPMAVDRSLHQLPLPPGGAAQAARQHSSASQGASGCAASCAERSSSTSIARGAASKGAVVPEDASLTSNGQAAGSHSSLGRVLSFPCHCMCLFSSF